MLTSERFCVKLQHTVEPRYFEDRIPLDLPLCFQSFTISYFEVGYFEFPAVSNSSFFPYTLNQARYFELGKNRVHA